MSEGSAAKPLVNEPVAVFHRSPLHVIRVIISGLLLALWCVAVLAIHGIWRVFRLPNLEKSYMIFHGGCCRLFNLRCEYEGELSTCQPTLYLCNHISYLDIFVLGKSVPGYFIAKSEVAGWPILGHLAKVQNTLFFERNSKKVRGQLGVMTEHFNKQRSLILFPEGTSTDGESVQPFKSSLLQSVEQSEAVVNIQPVTIAYTHYRDKPMNREVRDQYAWYATMLFAPHFFNALGLGKAQVKITYHPPVLLADFTDRKSCAEYCQQQVEKGLQDSLCEAVSDS
jgi:1-acyl-sn-glycerol-3-phosphate acyltransferase